MNCKYCQLRPSLVGRVRCQECLDVRRGYTEAYKLKNPEAIAKRRAYRQRKEKARRPIIRRELRIKVILMLGNRCACCGEAEPRFLTLDHQNNDGHSDRGAGRSARLYRDVLTGKRTDIRVLCFNCNCGRAVNGGVCPHEQSLLGVGQNRVAA